VTVPADFRALLAAQGGQKLHVFPTLNPDAALPPSIDVWSESRMQFLAEQLEELNPFTPEARTIGVLLGRAVELTWSEPEGRITLPQWLLHHAGVTEELLFVGEGPHFQIWEPGRRELYDAQALPSAYKALSGIDFRRSKAAAS